MQIAPKYLSAIDLCAVDNDVPHTLGVASRLFEVRGLICYCYNGDENVSVDKEKTSETDAIAISPIGPEVVQLGLNAYTMLKLLKR